MSRSPIPPWAIVLLIVGVLIFPIAIAVLWGVSALLTAMGDLTGATVLRYIALAGGLFWLLDLIALVVMISVNSLTDSDDRP